MINCDLPVLLLGNFGDHNQRTTIMASLGISFGNLDFDKFPIETLQYFDQSLDNALMLYASNPRCAIAFALALIYITYYLLTVVKVC